jgi:hypothetical protein
MWIDRHHTDTHDVPRMEDLAGRPDPPNRDLADVDEALDIARDSRKRRMA